MRETDPDDIIDWTSKSPDELRFVFELDPGEPPGRPVAREINLKVRNVPADSTFSASVGSHAVVSTIETVVDSRGVITLRFVVEAPAADGDDELEIELVVDGAIGSRTIGVRRTRCQIESALIHPRPGGERGQPAIGEHVRAALLWYGWNRFIRLVGIKRFDSGLSGSEVLVFRPRLAIPRPDRSGHDPDDFAGCSPESLWTESWGAWLLVKSGGVRQVRKEWSRHELFLRDRLTPFMARTEAMLRVHLAGPPTSRPATTRSRARKAGVVEDVVEPRAQATLISSFLGGDLIRAEPLEFRLQSGDDPSSSRGVIARAFETLAAWHVGGQIGTLGQFGRFFKERDGVFYLFGPSVMFPGKKQPEVAFDLTKREHRELFGARTTWDVPFQRREHLEGHLLGTPARPGLIPLLMKTRVRHGMIHGDLNPRNVLCDRDYAWLIDFEHAGYGPTLFDFAWLEANLRYFCLTLDPSGEGLDEAATRFEQHLLDHLHGSESSLEPVRRWALELGADPDQLHKLAAAIVQVRQLALPYCVDEYADHRDYLAVLNLSVLSLLRGDREMTAPPANYRVLVRLAWVLEEQLSRIHGLEPYNPDRATPDLKRLIDAEWLRAPSAPGRVDYLTRSVDGSRVLGPVAATRGVQQGEYHHLDVFDHTLSVLAYMEGLLETDDPLAGFLDPAKLDAKVRDDLARQGLHFPPGVMDSGGCLDAHRLGPEILEAARKALSEALNDDSRLLLKWCALLHDVGKPGVRSMSADGGIHVIGHPEYGLQLLEDHLGGWFDSGQVKRLRHLILRHHDPNNLAREIDGKLANKVEAEDHRIDRLIDFVTDPTRVAFHEFQALRNLVQAITRREELSDPNQRGTPERRREFPLLVLHGYADSLASRGRHAPISIGRRSSYSLIFLAAWQRHEALARFFPLWELCENRTHRSENPALNELVITNTSADRWRAPVLGQLPGWAWERVGSEGACPEPEEFVVEARRRLDLMSPPSSTEDATNA